MKRVVVFTEGGPGVGMGHLSRCSAVAEEFLRAGMTVEVYLQGPPQCLALFSECSAKVSIWTEETTTCRSAIQGAQVALFDSYRPSSHFYRALLLDFAGVPVFFDDLGTAPLDRGFVINGAPHAEELYGSSAGYRLLGGTAYQAMRSAFRTVSPRASRPVVQDLLVTLGGDDVQHLAPVLYQHLSQSQEAWSLTFITTANSRTRSELEDLVVAPHRLVVDASAIEMRQEFLKADLAISGAGQTTFEMAITGLPVVLIQVADNQRELVQAWQRLGYAPIVLPSEEAKDRGVLLQAVRGLLPLPVRQRIAHQGQSSVDGRGAQRIVAAILQEGQYA